MHRSTQLENTELWGLPYSVVGWKEGTLLVSFFKENNILFYIQKIHKVGGCPRISRIIEMVCTAAVSGGCGQHIHQFFPPVEASEL